MPYAQLSIADDHKTASPPVNRSVIKNLSHPGNNSPAAGVSQSYDNHSRMCSRPEFSRVRKIQVLRQQHPRFAKRRLKNNIVVLANERFIGNRMDVVTLPRQKFFEPLGQVFIQLDFHEMAGTSGIGKSSWTLAAANAMTSLTCCSVTEGKLARICSTESPSARDARIVLNVTRVPRKTGWPPQIAGSRMMSLCSSISRNCSIATALTPLVRRSPPACTRGRAPGPCRGLRCNSRSAPTNRTSR